MMYVYLLGSANRTLYVGVTSDLARRVWEHKTEVVEGFTKTYCVDRLLHFEAFEDPLDAIAREKQLKKWRRSKKIDLIEAANPHWEDLYDTLF